MANLTSREDQVGSLYLYVQSEESFGFEVSVFLRLKKSRLVFYKYLVI
ncbi:hypothetical protein FSA40_1764 [Streptococcus mutans]|nr:hypothetical protein FSA40_1764 [Streptococcus mutans]